jgi:hypothetical protein
MPDDDAPSIADLNLYAQALRNDWPVSPAVKRRLLQVAVDAADPAVEEEFPAANDLDRPDFGGRDQITTRRTRTRLAALRVIAQFARLNGDQQRLDLARERLASARPDAAAPHGGIDPAAAERALRALNGDD